MKNNLDIALCSLDVSWENKEKNFDEIEQLTQNIEADILLLPEMFSTGFSMNTDKVAEMSNGKSVAFMKKLAAKKSVVVCGSVPIVENKKYYNRLFWVYPNGNTAHYDKRHLFSYADEDRFYSSGDKKLIVDYKGWRICPLVCYDLRFPVWGRNVENYDLLIYIANWPQTREEAWQTLLKARSIENMSYVAGVNRSGKDVNSLNHSGFSMIYDGMGQMCACRKINSFVKIFSIDKAELIKQRSQFQFLNDRDEFSFCD